MASKTTNTKFIKIRVVTWYGKTTAYPICETAKTFAKIAKTTTLTKQALELIESLGFEIEIKTETPELEDIS